MTTLFLIRHAENDFMRKGRLVGWLPGVHLNERGRAQAAALVDLLARVRLQAIYSSPLERALETAEPLARARGLPVVARPDLGEIRYGRWQGRSLRSLSRQKMWSVVQHSPSLAHFPEGESFRQAQARIVAEIDALCARHPGPKQAIACFSHADAIKLAIADFIGLPLDLFQRLSVDPASISVLVLETGRVRLVRLNDTRATQVPDGP
jgi:probable phosphoglycerate mutase